MNQGQKPLRTEQNDKSSNFTCTRDIKAYFLRLNIVNGTYLTNHATNIGIAGKEEEKLVEFLSRQFEERITQRLKRISPQSHRHIVWILGLERR